MCAKGPDPNDQVFGRQNTLIQLQISLDGEHGDSAASNDQERMGTLMHSVSRLNAPHNPMVSEPLLTF